MNIPPGFVLDETKTTNYPPGFILDDQEQSVNKKASSALSAFTKEDLKKFAKDIPKYGPMAALNNLYHTHPQETRTLANYPAEKSAEGFTYATNLLPEGYPRKIGEFATDTVASTLSPEGIAMQLAGGPLLEGAASLAGKGLKVTGEAISRAGGLKALGLSKRFLNTSGARNAAYKAIEAAIGEKVITPLSKGAEIEQGAKELVSRSGKAVGDFLEESGQKGAFSKSDALSALEDLKPEVVRNAQAINPKVDIGKYSLIVDPIEEAKKTINLHPGEMIEFKNANEIKGFLQSLAKFNSTAGGSAIDREIAGVYRKALDTALENISEGKGSDSAFQTFKKNKSLFGAAQTMLDGIDNRLSTAGNNIGTLGDIATGGAAALAGGLHSPILGIPVAAATILAKKLFQIYGPSLMATGGKAIPTFINTIIQNPNVHQAILSLISKETR